MEKTTQPQALTFPSSGSAIPESWRQLSQFNISGTSTGITALAHVPVSTDSGSLGKPLTVLDVKNLRVGVAVPLTTEPAWFLGALQCLYDFANDRWIANSGVPLANIAAGFSTASTAAVSLSGSVAMFQDATNALYKPASFVSNAADALATNLLNIPVLGASLAFNGTTFDRLRTNAAAVISGTTQSQASLCANPGEWTLTSAPAANTAATATRAAGAAGVRHVLRSINASITAVAAITAPLTVVVRDGATGAGTILWQDRLTAPAGTQDRVTISGLNIVGSAATAMTVEFTAGPGATNFETLSATGYSTT